jgi:outer membrane protein OmpA-like peptidoglycan-associated protein
MNKSLSRSIWTVGLACVGGLALLGPVRADEALPPPTITAKKDLKPQEPIGFVTGGVIGAFAAGPIGAVVGAGIGTWLGNRVHRAGEAKKAEIQVAALETQEAALLNEKAQLAEMNRSLAVQVEQLTTSVKAVQAAKNDPTAALDGLQGDVLFRTGSAEVMPDLAHQIQVLAQAVAKSPSIKIRVDGYADPRGTVNANLKLSEARANAVRDLLLAAGVGEQSLEVNAYGKALSVADDDDGYALERRVRLTLLDQGAAVARADAAPPTSLPAVEGSASAGQTAEATSR